MPSKSRPNPRPVAHAIPARHNGLQVNACRTYGCENFGIWPEDDDPVQVTKLYRLDSAKPHPTLFCRKCQRRFSIYSNEALSVELDRVRSWNGATDLACCPTENCENNDKPLFLYFNEYKRHGKTKSGRERFRCRKCYATFAVGDEQLGLSSKHVNSVIMREITDRGTIRKQFRRNKINASMWYRRVDFIWRKMMKFEEYRLRRFVQMKKNKHIRLALSTDGQDQMVNWWSNTRRDPVQVSCTTTADNLSGYIFRTDINFDPATGRAGDHFRHLYEGGEFDRPGGFGLPHRYELRAFMRAAIWCLERFPSVVNRARIPSGVGA